MLEFTKWFYLVFGLLTAVGGLMGFLKAKSVASLIAGGLSGALLIAAYFILPHNLNLGLGIGLVVSVLLVGQFLPKLLHKDFKPHVVLSTVLGLIALALTLVDWSRH
jgi:uncharacterized membrane protein (UPF0136 family)